MASAVKAFRRDMVSKVFTGSTIALSRLGQVPMLSAKCRFYCLNTTIASGGRSSSSEFSKPWVGIASVHAAAEVAFVGAAVNRGIAVQQLAPVSFVRHADAIAAPRHRREVAGHTTGAGLVLPQRM